MENKGPVVKNVLETERNSLNHSKTSVSDLKRTVTIQTQDHNKDGITRFETSAMSTIKS